MAPGVTMEKQRKNSPNPQSLVSKDLNPSMRTQPARLLHAAIVILATAYLVSTAPTPLVRNHDSTGTLLEGDLAISAPTPLLNIASTIPSAAFAKTPEHLQLMRDRNHSTVEDLHREVVSILSRITGELGGLKGRVGDGEL
ncbi:hypothetical protein HDU98_000859 [Podochytrium sp. JEL0797]|nr:hypothetical protein HDU98_000859 [Podochytrium sp. JEL0797]